MCVYVTGGGGNVVYVMKYHGPSESEWHYQLYTIDYMDRVGKNKVGGY